MYIVETTPVFDEWLEQQPLAVRKKILASLLLLQQQGYELSRPHADTLYGSRFSNMKELRIQA